MVLTKFKFKKYLIFILIVGVAVTSIKLVISKESEKEKTKEKSQWGLVWSDEFNGNSLDMSKWSYDIGNWIVDESGNQVAAGWGNNELEYYTEGDNISFEEGKLIISAKKEQASDKFGSYDYTSSKIKTKGKYSKKYGRIEARMKLPEGEGLWPAFWMMPEDDVYGGWAASGEIDIMEARGSNTQQIGGAIHYGGTWPSNKFSAEGVNLESSNDITKFHTYAVEWEPGEIRWYIDDKLYFIKNNWNSINSESGEKYAFPAPFDQKFYVILNLAIGGWYVNNEVPKENFTDAQMLVDYVRIYEKTTPYLEAKEPSIGRSFYQYVVNFFRR